MSQLRFAAEVAEQLDRVPHEYTPYSPTHIGSTNLKERTSDLISGCYREIVVTDKGLSLAILERITLERLRLTDSLASSHHVGMLWEGKHGRDGLCTVDVETGVVVEKWPLAREIIDIELEPELKLRILGGLAAAATEL